LTESLAADGSGDTEEVPAEACPGLAIAVIYTAAVVSVPFGLIARPLKCKRPGRIFAEIQHPQNFSLAEC
jgi:hypothetical protein